MAIELGIAPGGLEPGEVEVKPSGWHILPSRCRRKAKPWTQADLSDMHRALAMLMRLPTAAEKAAFAAAYRKQQVRRFARACSPVALCARKEVARPKLGARATGRPWEARLVRGSCAVGRTAQLWAVPSQPARGWAGGGWFPRPLTAPRVELGCDDLASGA